MFSIFNYTDYRKALSDFYEIEKKKKLQISHRYIAQSVGFKSSGFFAQVIQGKSNISHEYIINFAKLMKLKKRESEYFEALVFFNQAKTHKMKKHYFDKLRTFSQAKVKIVDSAQYAFYDKWYYTAIREVLDFFPFKNDYKSLSRIIVPSITAEETKKSIELLEKLNLINKDKNGYYKKTDSLISTGYEAQALAINNFIIDTLKLAEASLDKINKDERNLSCLTLSIPKKKYPIILEECRAFRRKLMQMANSEEKADTVYQLNYQIFPMSKTFYT